MDGGPQTAFCNPVSLTQSELLGGTLSYIYNVYEEAEGARGSVVG
jgi:hypothetical protein